MSTQKSHLTTSLDFLPCCTIIKQVQKKDHKDASMSSKATTESNKAVNQPKKIALGNVVVVISLMVLAFIYHKFSTVKDSALNQDYYRVLYEASNKLNISLNQLKCVTSHRWY